MRAGREVDGVLLLDKPAGPSSNQALQRVKRLFGARKAGHSGTLDPLATGLLPILFGEATKFASYSADASKSYEATVLLGVRTSTGDITGEILERQAIRCSRQALELALDPFRGSIHQTPPMYSALKRDGQPLYRMARRGEVVFREPRPVRIDELVLVGEIRGDEIDLRVTCSKGTYIRVLAEDIGAALGCGGTLKHLRRTRVGSFDIENALTLNALENTLPQDRKATLLPIDAGLHELPDLALSDDQVTRVRQGQPVDLQQSQMLDGTFRLYGEFSGSFQGLGEASGGTVRALRLVSQAGATPIQQMT
jgi:tRNA pseudouridine55 synthase